MSEIHVQKREDDAQWEEARDIFDEVLVRMHEHAHAVLALPVNEHTGHETLATVVFELCKGLGEQTNASALNVATTLLGRALYLEAVGCETESVIEDARED